MGKSLKKLLAYMDENPRLWEEQGYGDINEGRIKKPQELALGRLRCAEAAFYLEDAGEAAGFLKLLKALKAWQGFSTGGLPGSGTNISLSTLRRRGLPTPSARLRSIR